MTIPYVALKEAHDDPQLEKLHIVLLMMLKDFSEMCKKHDIAWFLDFGSALGALRHEGFIPWDDDIDICLCRSELDKLAEIVKTEYSDKYEFISAQTCPSYPLATSRLIIKGTEFRDDNLKDMDFNSGIFLDLFPLDYLDEDPKKARKQEFRAWFYNKLALVKDVPNPYIAGNNTKAKILKAAVKTARIILRLPLIRLINWNNLAFKSAQEHQNQPSSRLAYLFDTHLYSHILNVSDLFPSRLHSFETIKVPVMNKVEKILEQTYGDWQYPPLQDMRREHYPHILNFGNYEPENRPHEH